MVTQDDKFRFTCTLERQRDHLRIEYTIDNRTADDALALVGIPSFAVDGAKEVLPENAYVDLKDGAVHILKRALSIPEGFSLDSYATPYGRVVPAGGAFAEAFVLPLPVKESNPVKRRILQREGMVAALKESTAREVIVSVGILASRGRPIDFTNPGETLCLWIHEDPAYPDLLSPFPPHRAQYLQTTLSARFRLNDALPVLEYESRPWPSPQR